MGLMESLRERFAAEMPQEDPRFAREALAKRLRGQADEIEAAIMARAFAVSMPASRDPEYIAGLRAAVGAAVEHGLSALESGSEQASPVPLPLLAQARMAARVGVPLDTMLRRYFAGYTLLLDFILAEARSYGDGALGGAAVQSILRCQSIIHERVVAAVSDEHARASKELQAKGEGQRGQIVRRLLAGEPLDRSLLGYQLEGSLHHGMVLRGSGGGDLVRVLSERGGYCKLIVDDGHDVCWAWLAARDAIDTRDLAKDISRAIDGEITVALGEPAPGVGGWRLTHQQARAAAAVAREGGDPVVRYVDVALRASLLQDELLAESLRRIYLDPLGEDRDGGEGAKRILCAYFDAGRNVSSAAAALGINRQTVTKRIQAIDERLGGALQGRAADLEVALLVDELILGRRREQAPGEVWPAASE
jgi:PucR C-terminal helix-turn-helix domain/GGDEF-like domain